MSETKKASLSRLISALTSETFPAESQNLFPFPLAAKFKDGKNLDGDGDSGGSSGGGGAPLLLRQFLAEVLGTFLLVLFGDGSIAQYAMLDPQHKNFLSVCFGYGFALMIGILVSGNVSGGHLNPAVTLAMACLRNGNRSSVVR